MSDAANNRMGEALAEGDGLSSLATRGPLAYLVLVSDAS